MFKCCMAKCYLALIHTIWPHQLQHHPCWTNTDQEVQKECNFKAHTYGLYYTLQLYIVQSGVISICFHILIHRIECTHNTQPPSPVLHVGSGMYCGVMDRWSHKENLPHMVLCMDVCVCLLVHTVLCMASISLCGSMTMLGKLWFWEYKDGNSLNYLVLLRSHKQVEHIPFPLELLLIYHHCTAPGLTWPVVSEIPQHSTHATLKTT